MKDQDPVARARADYQAKQANLAADIHKQQIRDVVDAMKQKTKVTCGGKAEAKPGDRENLERLGLA